MKYTQKNKEALFEQARTEIYVSEHYVFHFQPGSPVEKEIVTIEEIHHWISVFGFLIIIW